MTKTNWKNKLKTVLGKDEFSEVSTNSALTKADETRLGCFSGAALISAFVSLSVNWSKKAESFFFGFACVIVFIFLQTDYFFAVTFVTSVTCICLQQLQWLQVAFCFCNFCNLAGKVTKVTNCFRLL